MKKLRLACVVAAHCFAAGYAAPIDELVAGVRPLTDASSLTWIVKPDAKVPRPTPMEWQWNREGWLVGRRVDERQPWSIANGRQTFRRNDPGPWAQAQDASAKTAVQVVHEIIGGLINVRREGDAIVGELAPAFLAKELDFGRGAAKDASGWARFWVKEGVLDHYRIHREGTVVPSTGGTRRLDSTVEVQFTNVGSTTIVVPPDLKRLFDT
jgi:hypothetical protein